MPPETIVGRYVVLREIGRGGMGTVWLCRDRTLDREVAIKQIGGLPGESSPHVARALREARSSAALNHPHVVATYDAVEEGDHVWLVMEHVPSRTLSQLTRAEGRLDPPRAARIVAQIADGLAAAHRLGTVHRDVKPGNVLVRDDDVAKISDFGIARSLDDETLTQTGMVTGTPLYFSPQLARGASPTAADDVWALGATLHAAVEGAPPWPLQDNAIAMLVHIAEHDPATPQHAGPLAPVIAAMMAADPSERLTMSTAARRLHEIADDAAPAPAPAPFVPRPADPDPEPSGSTRRLALPDRSGTHPRVVAAAASVDGDEAPARRRVLPWVLAVLAVLVALAVVVALTTGLVGGDDDPDGTTAGPSTPGPTSASAEGDEGDEGDQETEPSPSDPTTATTPEEEVDPAAFVTDYYALLPDDPRSAWAMLSDDVQAEVGSYSSYSGFWATIDAVSVDDATETTDGAVTVDLTYTTESGTESETRSIVVDGSGTDALIVGDQGP